jgi:hypothetical protein
MNEMDMLSRLRDEVPLAEPSPTAQRAFRDGLTGATGTSRSRRPRHGAPFSLGRSSMLAGATALAVGVTAGLVVLALPSGRQPSTASATGATGARATSTAAAKPTGTSGTALPLPGTTRSAQLLADTAATAVLSQPAVKADQWVYRRMEFYRQPLPVATRFKLQPYLTENTWMMADGAHFTTTGSATGSVLDLWAQAPVPYGQLDSLPANPAALDAYLAHLSYPNPNATTANKSTAEFSAVEGLLTSYVLPPKLTAELFHALADIPTVYAKQDVKDLDGQIGVAFIKPANEQSVNDELILSPTDYRVLAQASWQAGVIPLHEEMFLAQALVSGPGKLP